MAYYNVSAAGQESHHHPADYELDDHDRAEIRGGRACWITGKAHAKNLLLAKYFGPVEFLVFLLAPKQDPYTIDDVLIPDESFGSSSSVRVPGRFVLRAARQARKTGRVIVAAAHGHGLGAVFSSGIDVAFMMQLAQEGVGWCEQVPSIFEGHQVESGSPDEYPDSTARHFKFENQPQMTVRVVTKSQDLNAGDLEIQLEVVSTKHVASFHTYNAYGDRWIPSFRLTRCSCCQSILEEEVLTDVVVHVLGDDTLTEAEQEEVLSEAKRLAPQPWFEQPTRYDNKFHESGTLVNAFPNNSSGEQLAEPPAMFAVTRHGETRYVDAAIMEEAAFGCPRLANALGWNPLPSPASGAGSSEARSQPIRGKKRRTSKRKKGGQSSRESQD